jgi:hypothetical protein
MPKQTNGTVGVSSPYHDSPSSSPNNVSRKRVRQHLTDGEILKKELQKREKLEAARVLLQKSEYRKQATFKKKLDSKIDQEIKLMSMESLKRKQKRLNRLHNFEQMNEESTKQKLELLQAASADMCDKRNKLIQKLTEIEVKEQIFTAAQFLKRKTTKEITYEEVKQLAKLKQREWIAEKIKSNPTKLAGNFIYNFEKFTQMPIEKEHQETAEQIRLYLQSSLDARRRAMDQSHKDAPVIYNKVMEDILKQREEEVVQYFNHKLHDDHLTKIKKLNHARTVLGLSHDEIEDLLEADVEVYETDIGIADAEMDRIRAMIAQHEKIRISNEINHDKVAVQLQNQIDHDTGSLRETVSIIHQLQDRKAEMMKEKESLFGDLLGLSLSAIEGKTVKMNHESEVLKRKSQELRDDLALHVKLDVQAKQELHSNYLKETEFEEVKANQRSDRVQLLDDELNAREQTLKALRDRITQLKQQTIDQRRARAELKKKIHLEQNRRLAEMIAYEDAYSINTQLIDHTSQELDFRQDQNGFAMQRLVSKLNNLKQILAEKEVAEATLVDNVAFLKAYVNEGEGIELPHQVLTVYKEQVDNKWNEWVETLHKQALEQARPAIDKTIYEQKIADLQDRYAHSCFTRDERGAVVGCDIEKNLVVYNPMKDTNESEVREENLQEQLKLVDDISTEEWNGCVRLLFKEQRVLSLIKYLYGQYKTRGGDTEKLKGLMKKFRRTMDIYDTEGFAQSELQIKNGTFSGGSGGIQYLIHPSHKLPPPNLDIMQKDGYFVPRSLQDENDMMEAEQLQEIDEQKEIDDVLYGTGITTVIASVTKRADELDDSATDLTSAVNSDNEDDIVTSTGPALPVIEMQPLRQVFETLTNEKIERKLRKQREREEDKDGRDREMEVLKDEMRNTTKTTQLETTEDIRSRLNKYLDINDATRQLEKKMQMVKKQKDRNDNITKELDRIKKLNARESSMSRIYKGINQIILSDSVPTDSEEKSTTTSTISEYELLDEEERRMVDEENSRMLNLGMFSPAMMLDKLKRDRNFEPNEL